MRIGRNFQDCLLSEYLSEAERSGIAEGRLPLAEAVQSLKAGVHTDMARQARVAADMGLQHVELEQHAPGLFSSLEPSALFAARETARIFGVTFSIHLAGPAAEEFIFSEPTPSNLDPFKQEINAFRILGCESMVLSCPRSRLADLDVRKAALLKDCAQYAYERGINTYLEVPAPDAEELKALYPLEESFYPLHISLCLSDGEPLEELLSGEFFNRPSSLFQYVRLEPGAEKHPGGVLLHRADDRWPSARLKSLLQLCVERRTEALIFSGNIQRPEDVLSYRRILAEENMYILGVLETLGGSPTRL